MNFSMKKGSFRNFGAFRRRRGCEFTVVARRQGGLSVIFYNKKSGKQIKEIEIDDDYRVGRVYSVYFPELESTDISYRLRDYDGEYLDPYAPVIVGREKWNDISRSKNDYFIAGGIGESVADFSEKAPVIEPQDMVIYKLHMRGFTEAASLPASIRGNYRGVVRRLPYLKSLGVTSVLFMPVYDFEEVRFNTYKVTEPGDNVGQVTSEPFGVNYWGYGDAAYFAPKASYFPDNPQKGMDALSNAVHRAGMELLMEFSFTSEQIIDNPRFIADILIWWHMRYRVDGFHLIGEGIPVDYLLKHPMLSNVKIFYNQIDERKLYKEDHKRFFYYNDDFVYPLRRLQNHMDGSVAELANQMRRQGREFGFVNYAAEKTGFTLLDAYSYGEKHNEANGEDNRDGSNYNCSSNHGIEGRTTSRNVMKNRMTCVRSALACVFLAQGVPLITEGDEALNTADGNNNPYGQDNAVGWVQFSNRKDVRNLEEFVKNLSEFRKAHPAIRTKAPMKQTDYLSCGLPDLSYHDTEPWIMGIGPEKKGLGTMYAGAYAGKDEEDVMVLINFYYDDRTYALPSLGDGKDWYLVANTGDEKFLDEPVLCDSGYVSVPGGTVSILTGR
ncbi:MAG: alpha-amylase family glycosyl hydrolase [Lachnospiraceae bacterium]|nr:alpha-amylase family glycosyl hydrolase [Lachnospiraceae bacterium]